MKIRAFASCCSWSAPASVGVRTGPSYRQQTEGISVPDLSSHTVNIRVTNITAVLELGHAGSRRDEKLGVVKEKEEATYGTQ